MNTAENPHIQVYSVGGSILFGHLEGKKPYQEGFNPVQFDQKFVGGLIHILQEQIERGNGVVIITGGGLVARMRIEDAKSYGETDEQDQLDHVGLSESNANAAHLLAILQRTGFQGEWYRRAMWGEASPGKVWVRGGTEPGHTTDYVAVEAAIAEGANLVVNIGSKNGLHPKDKNGDLNGGEVITYISMKDYLEMFDGTEHSPGLNMPFEPKAAKLAADQGISIVLIGGDEDNLRSFLAGGEYVGTFIEA